MLSPRRMLIENGSQHSILDITFRSLKLIFSLYIMIKKNDFFLRNNSSELEVPMKGENED